MNDKKWIISRYLIVFIVVGILPLLVQPGKGRAGARSSSYTDKAKAAKECVRSKEYMRAEHMQLLDLWREQVVRAAKREYVNPEGQGLTT